MLNISRESCRNQLTYWLFRCFDRAADNHNRITHMRKISWWGINWLTSTAIAPVITTPSQPCFDLALGYISDKSYGNVTWVNTYLSSNRSWPFKCRIILLRSQKQPVVTKETIHSNPNVHTARIPTRGTICSWLTPRKKVRNIGKFGSWDCIVAPRRIRAIQIGIQCPAIPSNAAFQGSISPIKINLNSVHVLTNLCWYNLIIVTEEPQQPSPLATQERPYDTESLIWPVRYSNSSWERPVVQDMRAIEISPDECQLGLGKVRRVPS